MNTKSYNQFHPGTQVTLTETLGVHSLCVLSFSGDVSNGMSPVLSCEARQRLVVTPADHSQDRKSCNEKSAKPCRDVLVTTGNSQGGTRVAGVGWGIRPQDKFYAMAAGTHPADREECRTGQGILERPHKADADEHSAVEETAHRTSPDSSMVEQWETHSRGCGFNPRSGSKLYLAQRMFKEVA